eukprot:g14473.t1.1.5e17418c g14473  g14473.t1 contig9:1912751-1913523(+)
MFVSIVAKLLVVLSIGNVCDAFLSPQTQAVRLNTSNVDASAVTVTSMNLAKQNEQDNISVKSRRSILSTIFNTAAATVGSSVFLPSQAFADAETMERGGVKLTPFNSLAFNYRGGESPSLDASALNEPSISYSDFLDKLASDQVTFVEFQAPNGDVAYATLKASGEASSTSSKPIRIGEGYPLEVSDFEGFLEVMFVFALYQ